MIIIQNLVFILLSTFLKYFAIFILFTQYLLHFPAEEHISKSPIFLGQYVLKMVPVLKYNTQFSKSLSSPLQAEILLNQIFSLFILCSFVYIILHYQTTNQSFTYINNHFPPNIKKTLVGKFDYQSFTHQLIAVCRKVGPPKDGHISIFTTYEYVTSHGTKELFADVIKLLTLR